GETLLASLPSAFIWCPGQTGIARHRLTISQVTRKDFLHEHVCGLDTDANHAAQQSDHLVAPDLGSLLQSLGTSRLDLFDLLLHQKQAGDVTSHLSQRVRWHWSTSRHAQRLQMLHRVRQERSEVANAKSSEIGLHSVDDACAF